MPPTIVLTDHDKRLALLNPHQPGIFSLTRLRPSVVRFAKNLLHLTIGFRKKKLALIAEAAEFFDEHFVRVSSPVHLPEVHAFGGCFDGQPL